MFTASAIFSNSAICPTAISFTNEHKDRTSSVPGDSLAFGHWKCNAVKKQSANISARRRGGEMAADEISGN
jgi:hypothetical protein